MFASGVKEIYPIGNVDIAYKMKEENPTWILAGERGGAILPGFDTGNAPSELYKLELDGKTVVHTTSAGTQGVANATEATELLGAGLVNARATAEYIRRSGAEEVSLVCMGLEAKEPTEEDTLCARYIKAILEGKENEIDMPAEIENLKDMIKTLIDYIIQFIFLQPIFNKKKPRFRGFLFVFITLIPLSVEARNCQRTGSA